MLYGVNGVNLTSDPVAPDLTWHGRFGYFAGTGQTNVRVKVDSTSLVDETDETDNEVTFSFAPADPAPPFKLVNPVEGEFQEDWTVTAYALVGS